MQLNKQQETILKCWSQLRQSMTLGKSTLKLTSANQTTANEMWNAADKGIIHIISTTLGMSKASAQCFGSF